MSRDVPPDKKRDTVAVGRTQVSGGIDAFDPTSNRDTAEHQAELSPQSAEQWTTLVGGTQWSMGQVVEGRFEVHGVAGVGGMGIVYRAYDKALEADVALKLLRPGAEQDRFVREARLLSGLVHDNIVRYIAHGTAQGMQLYLAMEWLEGHDLAKHLQRQRLTIAQAVRVVLQVSRALAMAHDLGIVHRDVNPRNIFLVGADPERVKVLDFGVARPHTATRHLTNVGSPIGTPGYMAPEQAQGAGQITAAADVFSLGCVLFEALTGRRAFAGHTLMELFARILVDEVPRVSSMTPSVPTELDALVHRMLSKAAEQRPAHGREVVQLLERLGPLSDEALSEPGGPLSESAITDVEQRFSSIILLSSIPSEAFGAVVRSALAHGVSPEQMADGSVLAILANRGSATDQVAAAARCALDIRAAVPGAIIAVATGRAVTHGAKPKGDAIERASAALMAASRGPAERRAVGVFLDQVTADLLDVRFDVRSTEQGLLLGGTRELGEAVRTVLGRHTRCVGRRRELSFFSTTLEECIEESVARAVLVTGPSGIGKTRLAHEFLRLVRRGWPDTKVMTAAGEPTGIGSPFAILGRAIRGFAEIAQGAPDEEQQRMLLECLSRAVEPNDLRRVHEFLCELTNAPLADAASSQLLAARLDHVLAGDQMLRAFEDWLSAECRQSPVLMVLDDFHWGDLPSVKFLDAVLRNLGEEPLMVVALGQPEIHEVFPELWSRRGLLELRLTGLSRRASESLVRDVLGQDADGQLVARVVEKAQGNPFWLEELVRADFESEAAPEAIVLLAQARLERLNGDARRVLRAASVLGRRFWDVGVGALLGAKVSGPALSQLLRNLEDREIVSARASSRFPGQREFEFTSSLWREAAYGTLTTEDRERAHLAAGAWLEALGDTDAVVLAEHFSLGGAAERALAWHLRAAEQALSGNDWQAARDRAKAGCDAGAHGEIEVRLILVQAEASKWLGDNVACLERSLEALEKAGAASALWCRACGEALATAGKLGQQPVYGSLAPRLLRVELGPHNEVPLMIALSRGATQLVLCGELDLAESLLARVHELCKAVTPGPASMGWILEARAVRAGALDDASQRVELAARAAEQFELAGDLRNACLQRISVGFACVEIGAYARATAQLNEGLEVARRMGLSNSIPIARAQLGRALAQSGAGDAARALLIESIVELDRHGNARLAGSVRCYLANALLKQGALDEAERAAGEAVRILDAVPAIRPMALATLAMVRLAEGAPEACLSLAAEANTGVGAATRLNFGEALVRLSHVLALRANGRLEEARARLEQAYQRLLTRAELISDPELKQLFLTAVAENAQTIELHSALDRA